MKKIFVLLIVLASCFMYASIVMTGHSFVNPFDSPEGAITLLFAALTFVYQISRTKGAYGSFAITTTPTAFSANMTEAVVSSLDLNIRKVLPELYARFGRQGAEFLDMIRSMGYERVDGVVNVEHYEDNWMHDNFQTSTTQAAGSAGAARNLTLSPNSLDSDNRFYPQVNDVVAFSNDVLGLITAVDISTPSAPVLTVVPKVATESIPATTSGDFLMISTNSWSEGSTQPGPRVTNIWKYLNTFAIAKQTVGATGTQIANDSWVSVYEGKTFLGYFNKTRQWDLEYRTEQSIQGGFLTDKRVTNSLAVDSLNSNAVAKGTEGMFPYLDRVAIPYSYVPGMMQVTDFDTQDRLLRRANSPRNIAAVIGQDYYIEIENAAVEYFKFNNVDYTEMGARNLYGDASDESRQLYANIGFKGLGKSGRNYFFKEFTALNNPKTFGTSGYNWTGRGVYFPLEKRKEANSQKMLPCVGIVWKGLGAYNRKMEVFDIGGAGIGPKQTPVDSRNYYTRSEYAAEFFGGVQMMYIKPN